MSDNPGFRRSNLPEPGDELKYAQTIEDIDNAREVMYLVMASIHSGLSIPFPRSVEIMLQEFITGLVEKESPALLMRALVALALASSDRAVHDKIMQKKKSVRDEMAEVLSKDAERGLC